MAKIRNEQHRIGSRAVDIFKRSLPSEKLLDITLEEIKNDYGVDAMIQIFKAEQNTGEIAYVQIKGQKELKLTKGKGFAQRMKINDLEFLLETIDYPVLLVVSDIKSEKCYWLDLQVDPLTTQIFVRAKGKSRKFITLYINPANKLPESIQGFLASISSSKLHLQERIELKKLREIADKNLDLAIKKLDEYANKLIDIPGFSLVPTNDNSDLQPIMSTITSNGVKLDLYPNKDFTDGLQPQIKISIAVPEKDKKSLAILEDIPRDPSGLSKLDPKYISSCKIQIGEKIITDYKKKDKTTTGVLLSIKPNTRKMQLFIRNISNGHELAVDTETWITHDQILHFSTPENNTQFVQLRGELNPTNKKLNISFKIIAENLHNVRNAYKTLSVFNNLKEGLELYMNEGGFKTFLSRFHSEKEYILKSQYKLFRMLNYIQEKTIEDIPAFNRAFSDKEISNIIMIYKAFHGENIKLTLTSTVNVKESKEEPLVGKVMKMETASFYLFGKELHIKHGHKLIFLGTISKVVKEAEGQYKITSKNTSISFL
jgi:hypothetical protein